MIGKGEAILSFYSDNIVLEKPQSTDYLLHLIRKFFKIA